MKYICYFLPALLAADKEVTDKKNYYQTLVIYSKYCIYINGLTLLFLIILKKSKDSVEGYHTVLYYLIYLILGITLSIILPRVLNYCRKNFSIKIKRQ